MNEAKKKVIDDLKKMRGGINRMKDEAKKAYKEMKSEIPAVGRATELLTNKYVLMAAGIGGVITASVMLGNHLADQSRRIEQFQNKAVASYSLQGKALKETTAQALAISDTLKVDQLDLLQAANSMSQEYKDQGLTINDSLKLIRKGIQATGGNFDLQEIKEYSAQMRAAGLSAEQFVALSAFSRKRGVFDDKGVDAVKEFNLRIKEMPTAAKDALTGIGLNHQRILRGLDNGSLKTIDVLKQVSKAMGSANIQARQTAMADLFGGAGEDAGMKFLLSLKDANLSLRAQMKGMEGIVGHQNKMLKLNKDIQKSYLSMDKSIKPMRKEWEIQSTKAKAFFFGTMAKGFKMLVKEERNQSDQMRTNRAVANSLFEALKSGNEAREDTRYLISKINQQYGDMLPNMLTEKSTLKEISDAHKMVADSFEKRIQREMRAEANKKYDTQLFKTTTELERARLDSSGFSTILASSSLVDKKEAAKLFGLDRLNLPNYNAKTMNVMKGAVDLRVSRLKGEVERLQKEKDRQNALFDKHFGSEENLLSEGEVKKGMGEPINTSLADDVAKVAGGGNGVKNITINIEALNKGGINTENTILNQMNPDEIEAWFNEAMMKLLRNVELSN